MMLYVEYLVRRKLLHLIPEEYRENRKPLIILVRPDRQTDILVWSYFLTQHHHFIEMISIELSQSCDKWIRDRNPWRPPLDEQRQLIFQAVPHLKPVWKAWVDSILANEERW